MRIIVNKISAIIGMMKDKSASKLKKVLIIFGVVYFFAPIELLPDFLLPFGYIDDIVLWAAILYYLKDSLKEYGGNKNPKNYSKKYKDAIDDVEFEVKDETVVDDELDSEKEGE